jgi:hypothetical protein
MQIQNATIDSAQIQDLNAVTAKVTTLLADYIKTDELEANVAKINTLTATDAIIQNLETMFLTADSASFKNLSTDVADIQKLIAGTAVASYIQGIHLTVDNSTIDSAVIKNLIAENINVFDLMAANITADKSLTLVSRDGYGSIVLNNATMQFKDENGNVRVQIGKDALNAYSISIYGSAASDGSQKVLWNSSGITSDAIANSLIVNNMLADETVTGTKIANKTIGKDKINWDGIAESVDSNNVPTFSAGNISVDGGTLETKWTSLKSDVASIDLVASSQVFSSTDGGMTYTPDTITITPYLHIITKDNLVW